MQSKDHIVQKLDVKNLGDSGPKAGKRKRPVLNGPELRRRRNRLGYTQEAFMIELGVKSRQTLISWEKLDAELPRLVQLAVFALEELPDCRRLHGKKATALERKAFEKTINAKAARGEELA